MSRERIDDHTGDIRRKSLTEVPIDDKLTVMFSVQTSPSTVY